MKKLTLLVAFALITFSSIAQEMDNKKLDKIIHALADTAIGANGAWEFIVGETLMMCISDETNNRMRIISPIKEYKDLTPEQMQDAMEANFHSALDVRYALSDNIVWVAYIHPLKELREGQVRDAIAQVYAGADPFQRKKKLERKRDFKLMLLFAAFTS